MNFNPYYNPYQQRFDMQPQTIQNMNLQPQASCYFVKSANDLNGLNVMPNTFYLGINTDANEIYVRRMNNDGLVDIKTYTLQSEKKEKTDFQAIFDRLDGIEKKIAELPQRQTLTLKGKDNERTNRTNNE